jgi:MtN3 and saliva related transmembrane protein
VHESFGAIDGVGYLAGLLTTGSAVPQVVKSWRTRSVQDLSLAMLCMLNIGLLCWLVYGVSYSDWPIVLTNGCSFALWCSLLVMKIGGRGPRSSRGECTGAGHRHDIQ